MVRTRVTKVSAWARLSNVKHAKIVCKLNHQNTVIHQYTKIENCPVSSLSPLLFLKTKGSLLLMQISPRGSQKFVVRDTARSEADVLPLRLPLFILPV